MAMILEKLEEEALRLPPAERGQLIHRLLVSLEVEPEESPEAIAQAWDEEIAHRVAEIDAGAAVLIPEEDVLPDSTKS